MKFKKLAAMGLAGMMTMCSALPVFAAEGYVDKTDPFADSKTPTSFSVENKDDLNEDNGGNGKLGGELVVSIPAEMVLAADGNSNAVLVKADTVSAKGRMHANEKLSVLTATNISYANADDASVTVPGVIAFGTASGDNQLTEWSAEELVTGVKGGTDAIVKKDISSTVQKADIDYIGFYATNITYNISVATN